MRELQHFLLSHGFMNISLISLSYVIIKKSYKKKECKLYTQLRIVSIQCHFHHGNHYPRNKENSSWTYSTIIFDYILPMPCPLIPSCHLLLPFLFFLIILPINGASINGWRWSWRRHTFHYFSHLTHWELHKISTMLVIRLKPNMSQNIMQTKDDLSANAF